jgi:hypothetical protein
MLLEKPIRRSGLPCACPTRGHEDAESFGGKRKGRGGSAFVCRPLGFSAAQISVDGVPFGHVVSTNIEY